MGHGRLTHSEILAFSQNYRLDLDEFDAETLIRLDWTWLRCRPQQQTRKGPKDDEV
jgi:hypothetical protein